MKEYKISENENLVSIVLLCWNRLEDVMISLKKLKNINGIFEIILVDNASTDKTVSCVKEKYNDVKILTLDKNIGIAGWNEGVKMAACDYVILLDDDCYPSPDSIEFMVEKFQSDRMLGVCAFDVRSRDFYDKSSTTNLDKNSMKAEDFGTGFNGACVGVRKDIFLSVGGFDKDFFLYMNEADCTLRIRQLNLSVKFFPDLVAYHKMSPTNRTAWRAPFYYTRNTFWLIWKNYPIQPLILATISLIFHCFLQSIEQRTLIYIRSLLSAFINMKIPLRKRLPLSKVTYEKVFIPLLLCFTFYK